MVPPVRPSQVAFFIHVHSPFLRTCHTFWAALSPVFLCLVSASPWKKQPLVLAFSSLKCDLLSRIFTSDNKSGTCTTPTFVEGLHCNCQLYLTVIFWWGFLQIICYKSSYVYECRTFSVGLEQLGSIPTISFSLLCSKFTGVGERVWWGYLSVCQWPGWLSGCEHQPHFHGGAQGDNLGCDKPSLYLSVSRKWRC